MNKKIKVGIGLVILIGIIAVISFNPDHITQNLLMWGLVCSLPIWFFFLLWVLIYRYEKNSPKFLETRCDFLFFLPLLMAPIGVILIREVFFPASCFSIFPSATDVVMYFWGWIWLLVYYLVYIIYYIYGYFEKNISVKIIKNIMLFLVNLGIIYIIFAIYFQIQFKEKCKISHTPSGYCQQNGGVLENIIDQDGGKSRMCHFSDGSQCEEWAYMRGECNIGDSLNQSDISAPVAPIAEKLFDLSIISPNGGEVWTKGNTYQITWSKGVQENLGNNANLILYKGNKCSLNNNTGKQVCGTVYNLSPVPPTSIAVNIPNTGSYKWTIPNSLPSGSDYRIAVQDPDRLSFIDQSNTSFSIQ